MVQSLLGLIKLRNSHLPSRAIASVLDEGPHLLTIRWSKGAREVILRADPPGRTNTAYRSPEAG